MSGDVEVAEDRADHAEALVERSEARVRAVESQLLRLTSDAQGGAGSGALRRERLSPKGLVLALQ